jgi:hypothetical protein
VAIAAVAARVPDYLAGGVHPSRAVLRVAESWYTVGPALVLCLAGATSPDWGDWTIYLGALGAQFAFDFVASVAHLGVGLRMRVRPVANELVAIYSVDALLAPVGLLAAFAAATEPWASLLVLPLLGLIAIFAREREARIESVLTLRDAYRGTAHLLGEVLATTHEYTGSHSRSVVVIARQVGVSLGVSELVLREIEFGALLHDVGKMAVPNEILNKPAALTDDEMRTVRRHTLEGERMLERIGGMLGEMGPVVRHHHERFDGTGYPDGLRGEEIPLASRVISACDAFHAMISERPYREPLSLDAAINELHEGAGGQFDPEVVAALVGIVEAWDAPSRDEAGGQPDTDPSSEHKLEPAIG